ncbi:MAG: TonB-dependent receptor [Chitinophagales bacterium]
MKPYLTIVALFLAFGAMAQNGSLSGTVRDAKNGEELIGATVYLKEQPATAVPTNAYGFYSLSAPRGKWTLAVRYIGYDAFFQSIDLTGNQVINVNLQPTSTELKQVEVTSKRADENVKQAQMSVTKLDMREMAKIPVIFGEKDILKTIQLLPGVVPTGEGSAGYVVRGGGPDQNLILLDEAPVYNASHLLGFFSTFNNDAIKDATLYKGNAPAEFGGRLSSVLDVKMKEGNDKQYSVSGGLGLIASRLSIEGPIVKEKGSFIITGRRTYADIFTKLSKNEAVKKSKLYFYDINAKVNYRFGSKDRVFLSGYFGRDVFGLGNSFGIDYGNWTATARWNHIFNNKLFSNTSFIFNNFSYAVNINFSDSLNFTIKSQIQDYGIKEDLDYFLNAKNKFKFGFLSTFHTIVPGEITASANSQINPVKYARNYGWENAIYAQHEVTLWDRVNVNYGVRLSTFTLTGPGKYYTFNSNGTTDTAQLKFGQFGKTYVNAEPRISVSCQFAKNMSLKAAYSRSVQHVHQLSNTTTSNPTDRWVLTSNNIKPELADQYSLGYFFNFHQNMFELSVEGYYKYLYNQIDYVNGAVLRANETIESQLVYGIGRSYGGEFFLKKRTGKFTGWISYTLSRTERKFESINNNTWFPSRYDRTHDISIVLMYDITPRINVSATWVYYTGNAATFASGKYALNGAVIPYYGPRNQDRFPAYHRLDIGATFILKKHRMWEHDLNISFYNLYARKNAYQIEFEKVNEDASTTKAVKTYLFRIVPSITYNFRFTALKKEKHNKP